MSIHIIIDGYNLIRQSSTLSVIDGRDIESGRRALIESLAMYKKVKPHKITVVFDGTKAPSLSSRSDKMMGINIRFSRNGELADAMIKRMVAREKERAVVVSSDMDIVRYSESRGAITIDSPRFEDKMLSALYFQPAETDNETDVGWKPTTRKKGPKKRLPKRRRQARKKHRKL